MPRVSIFTPSHDPRFLSDACDSVLAQSFPDWEWIVLVTGKARQWTPPQPDDRIRVERTPSAVRTVGGMKAAACELATGDFLVELDHDDRLLPDTLVEVVDAMTKTPTAAMVYSDFAQIDASGAPSPDRFDPSNGWGYTEVNIAGKRFQRCHAMSPTPHNVGYIWYAPNHVRAFRKTWYDEVGGFDADLDVLSDQDLMIRLYERAGFVHVPELLYLQRDHPHAALNDPRRNAAVQEGTVANYLQHIEHLALAASSRAGLGMLALRTPTATGELVVDELYTGHQLDTVNPRLPFADNSVGVIKGLDVLQHVPDRAALFNECHRVLTHAGMLLLDVPSTDGRGAFADPSNVSFYNENSFMYLTQSALRPAIPSLQGTWQVSHLTTYFPTEVHEQIDLPYVKANLMPIKDGGPRQGGPIL